MPSIFSRIVAGELPCSKVYEDERVLAFLDINPVSEGHTLIISKREAATIEDSDPEDLAALARAARIVGAAVKSVTGCPAYNLIINNGPGAGQEVPHLHAHIIPRFEGDGLRFSWPARGKSREDLAALSGRLRAEVANQA